MKTIIIDDEVKASLMLEIELRQLFPDIEILGTYQQADAGVVAINELKPDLLFLDIEMPKKSGFDVLKEITHSNIQVIFVTAYSAYALDAIKANALDYILKPIDTEELKIAVQKAKEKQSEQKIDQFHFLLSQLDHDKQLIKIPSGDQILFFRSEEIVYCKAESNYTSIITTQQKILVSKTLKHIEQLLKGSMFIRIHQSYLVNKEHIRAYSKLDGGFVVLSNGDHAKVAKNKKDLVL